MRLMRCTLPEGAAIAVQGPEVGRMFRRGDTVDLDAIAVPISGDRPAHTWGEALGHHVDEAFGLAAELDPTLQSQVEPGELTGPLGSAVRPLPQDDEE